MVDFLILALLAGLGIALVAGPLGTFVVWRRMAYLGDTLAHSALLGVALGLILALNLNLAVVIVCVGLAVFIVILQHKQILATDTLLGILAHASLALGLVVVSLSGGQRIDLNSYLFGDLLASNLNDVILIYVIAFAVGATLTGFWRPLLNMTVHEELAQVEGVNVTAMKTLLMVMTALVIALAMKAVGILLITALLIIPAAASRRFVRTPEGMALLAACLGCGAVISGLACSYLLDTPAGPSIVLSASVFFIASLFKKQS